MRKLLLNPTPLFRKLRQLSLLLTLLLALPQTAWGKRYTTTGNVIDATGNNAGTRFTWETNATQTAEWRWVIDCEAGTVTSGISTLTFTLPAGKNITMSFGGSTNSTNADYTTLRKFTFDGLSNELTVSAALTQESTTYNFTGSNGVFTPSGNTNSIDMNGVLNVTITNNSANSVTCTINSITVLTGPIISSDGLVWPENAEDPSTESAISGITKSVSNNATTLSGNLNVDDIFSFPLKRDFGNQNIVELNKGDNLNYDIAYSSSNTNVAEVSGGDVTIKGYGSTTITATLTENDYYSYEQSTYSYTLTNTQTFESYGITVAGTRVTAENANNIFNDGKVVYTHNDDGTGTLTLNGATLTGMIRVSRPEALTIELIGANSITPSDSSAIKADFGTTQTPPTPNLIFKGEGYVTLTPGPTYPAIGGFNVDLTTNGMYAHGSLTTNGTSGSVAKKYELTVAGLQVTSENKENVFANVSFTPASTGNNNVNTLTLNGASLNGSIISGLSNLTISFQGDNELTGTSGHISSTDNTAPLTLKGGTGTSTLSLNNSDGQTAISGFVSLTYDGAYLTASRACRYVTGTNPGIKDIEGGIVQPITITTEEYYPLWVKSIQVKPGNKEHVLGDTDYTVIFDGNNTLTLNGASFSNSNAIESNLDNLTIKLKGNNSVATYTYGHSVICSGIETATLTIAKDDNATGDVSLYLKGGGDPLPPVIRGFASVTHTRLNYASQTRTAIDANATKVAVLTSATIYDIWVGGTLVTSAVSSGSQWSYEVSTNTLTLNNYTEGNYNGHAFISNLANLNVYLIGTNDVDKYISTSTDKAFFSAYPDATLTFNTDESNMGKLDASGFDTFCEGFRNVNGIYCNNGLGYYPGTREIKAKATPTISFAKWNESTSDYTGGNVGVDETLNTTYGNAFKAPKPTFNTGYQLNDTTKYVYTYSVDDIVVFPNNGEDNNNPGKIIYGEINLLKAGTVTITCTFPGNMQNNPCSASYTLQVNKADLTDGTFHYSSPTYNAFIDVDRTTPKGGIPNQSETAISYPTLVQPTPGITDISYESSDTDVASIDANGAITLNGKGGVTTIKATVGPNDNGYNERYCTYQLTVKVPAIIEFGSSTASIMNSETYTQTATVTPEGAPISYTSSDDNAATVDANGKVTPNSTFSGKVTIKARITNMPNTGGGYYYFKNNDPAFETTYELTVSKNLDFSNIFTDASMTYATCIMPEPLTRPTGLKVYYITGTSGDKVTTEEIDYLPYGVPILLEKTAETFGSVTARTDSSAVITGNILQYAGATDKAINSITGGTPYILYKSEFVKATGTSIKANKCYFVISSPNPARGFVIEGGNDGSTAIDDTLIDNEETENGEWYDLQGRRITKPTKAGLYIVNGKKVVVTNK